MASCDVESTGNTGDLENLCSSLLGSGKQEKFWKHFLCLSEAQMSVIFWELGDRTSWREINLEHVLSGAQ